MRALRLILVPAVLCWTTPLAATAQIRQVSDAECQALRGRAAEHAKVSEAARKALAALAPPAPAVAAPPAATPPAADRAAAIRARLE